MYGKGNPDFGAVSGLPQVAAEDGEVEDEQDAHAHGAEHHASRWAGFRAPVQQVGDVYGGALPGGDFPGVFQVVHVRLPG
ncbi:hypothetical protein QQG74_09025 [Micromonospora sp. FIMYZ51]|uniref:hypothetical protein n=1 Tax=Micromonospora sp. FIMYZ51 TaxID=3051832 RepID=UPI00311D6611